MGSPDIHQGIGMGSLLDLFCNGRSCILDLSYSYLYLHDICPVVTDIDFMISLLCYYVLYVVRDLVLVNIFVLQYLYVCSSMISIHPKRGASRVYYIIAY